MHLCNCFIARLNHYCFVTENSSWLYFCPSHKSPQVLTRAFTFTLFLFFAQRQECSQHLLSLPQGIRWLPFVDYQSVPSAFFLHSTVYRPIPHYWAPIWKFMREFCSLWLRTQVFLFIKFGSMTATIWSPLSITGFIFPAVKCVVSFAPFILRTGPWPQSTALGSFNWSAQSRLHIIWQPADPECAAIFWP